MQTPTLSRSRGPATSAVSAFTPRKLGIRAVPGLARGHTASAELERNLSAFLLEPVELFSSLCGKEDHNDLGIIQSPSLCTPQLCYACSLGEESEASEV